MGTINTDEDFERVANVSNPLGWDGDIARILRSDRGDRVSNPLGWDGDSGCLSQPSGRGRFLIH